MGFSGTDQGEKAKREIDTDKQTEKEKDRDTEFERRENDRMYTDYEQFSTQV